MTSHNYHSLFVVRICKIHVPSNFQVYSTALFSIITMLYIRFLELFHLPSGSFFSLISMVPIYLPLTILLFVSISLAFLDFIFKYNQETDNFKLFNKMIRSMDSKYYVSSDSMGLPWWLRW